jgi:hypothetical protein
MLTTIQKTSLDTAVTYVKQFGGKVHFKVTPSEVADYDLEIAWKPDGAEGWRACLSHLTGDASAEAMLEVTRDARAYLAAQDVHLSDE